MKRTEWRITVQSNSQNEDRKEKYLFNTWFCIPPIYEDYMLDEETEE
jgi:hypothetical protein